MPTELAEGIWITMLKIFDITKGANCTIYVQSTRTASIFGQANLIYVISLKKELINFEFFLSEKNVL